MLPYWVVLLISGIVFTAAERVWPRQPQPVARRGYFLDLIYVVFNAEIVGALVAILLASQVPASKLIPLRETLRMTWIGELPVVAQMLLLLLVKDFFQWCVHNLLHRVPLLWRFHRTHHSTEQMDWLSNWRFHWLEVVVYQSVLYLPATLLSFSGEAVFACAVVSTTIGHFAHANLRWHVGPLKYIINSPEMHVWHHVHPDHGPANRNFCVSLSIWDWIFRTAYVPSSPPARLGLRESQ